MLFSPFVLLQMTVDAQGRQFFSNKKRAVARFLLPFLQQLQKSVTFHKKVTPMKRFGVSLEDDLLEKLDELVESHKFPNRSQAIRFLVRKHMAEEQWETGQKVSGCLVLVYDHHKSDLQNKLTAIQHDAHHLVLCCQHVHLDHNNCIETITLKGKATELRELADRLIAVKGIIHGELVMSVLKQ